MDWQLFAMGARRFAPGEFWCWYWRLGGIGGRCRFVEVGAVRRDLRDCLMWCADGAVSVWTLRFSAQSRAGCVPFVFLATDCLHIAGNHRGGWLTGRP